MRVFSEFYQALNGRDLEKMSLNWVQSEEAVMDNPLGGIRRGWEEISSVYRLLFDSRAQFRFEFYDYSYHEARQIFYVVGRERGGFKSKKQVIKLEIRTSRIFSLIDGSWWQVHHHGSIDDPGLLASYQRAVRGDA